MINNKRDLAMYLQQDRIALGKINQKRPKLFSDEIWKFQIAYRKYEYYHNCKKGIVKKLLKNYWKLKYHRWSIRLNFTIPINVFGPGLAIAHYGTIVINGNAKIGRNCRIHENVTIGATNGKSEAPILGHNIFIGTGAKIIGDLRIADDIAIGAGSVVTKSFTEQGITIGGIPAKKISNNNSHMNLNSELFSDV